MRHQLVQLGNGAHALATQMLGNVDEARDAVHDAYLKVLDKPGAYDANAGPLSAWFLRVVRNHCIDLIRRRRPGTVDVNELSDTRPQPQDRLEIMQRDQQLEHALERLPSGQRQIIVLRDYMDLTYAEIAVTLDIAKGTVMSRLHRARLALREELIHNG